MPFGKQYSKAGADFQILGICSFDSQGTLRWNLDEQDLGE